MAEMIPVAFLFFATLFVWFLESQDTTTLIVTRHAEVATLGGREPDARHAELGRHANRGLEIGPLG